jgi:hypothetical protein
MKPIANRKLIAVLGLILASLLVAAYLTSDDRSKPDVADPQKIACRENLEQIGLAFRTWSLDHGDRLPFEVSKNSEGTLEFCDRDRDGFDKNGFLHFAAASNELSIPKILVCPNDRSKMPATDFGILRASNVTYRLRSGSNVNYANAAEVLAVCPIDGNTLYCNGAVKEGKRR